MDAIASKSVRSRLKPFKMRARYTPRLPLLIIAHNAWDLDDSKSVVYRQIQFICRRAAESFYRQASMFSDTSSCEESPNPDHERIPNRGRYSMYRLINAYFGLNLGNPATIPPISNLSHIMNSRQSDILRNIFS